jgi:hypothetical protein
MRALLDVNVVIALLDASHTFHRKAHSWWAVNAMDGWAGCPLVENGVVRVMASPAYSSTRRFSVEGLVASLSQFVSATNHEFWCDDLSLRDTAIFATERVLGSKQLSDVYLLALAANHAARLVTFDQAIPLSAVKGASPANLVVL